MPDKELITVANHDFGYSLRIPENWRDVGPFIYNSVYEVARYLRTDSRIHDGIVNVFWDIPGASPREAAESGDPTAFDLNRESLEKEGVKEISLVDVTLGGHPATRLDHAYRLGDIEDWASRSYFLAVRNTNICLNMGTSTRDADRELYDRIAESFRVVDDAVGIVFVRDAETPGPYIVQLLETRFAYPHNKAMQRMVRINAQRESVVALVERGDAPGIVEAITRECRDAGHPFICRIAGDGT